MLVIYLVEDDAGIRELVAYTLENTGFPTVGFGLPSDFWAAMKKQLPSLVLLDVMLPEQDGLSILQELRADARTQHLPIILLTAKDMEMDKVKGFEAGADDYVAKPFGMMELLVRIKAVLRRVERTQPESVYRLGNLYVCPEQHLVRVDDRNVTLTLKEFNLLCLLLENENRVLTRDQILNKIWNYSFDGEGRTVDVHIRTLRRKLGSAGDLIQTVRGMGYKISTDENV